MGGLRKRKRVQRKKQKMKINCITYSKAIAEQLYGPVQSISPIHSNNSPQSDYQAQEGEHKFSCDAAPQNVGNTFTYSGGGVPYQPPAPPMATPLPSLLSPAVPPPPDTSQPIKSSGGSHHLSHRYPRHLHDPNVYFENTFPTSYYQPQAFPVSQPQPSEMSYPPAPLQQLANAYSMPDMSVAYPFGPVPSYPASSYSSYMPNSQVLVLPSSAAPLPLCYLEVKPGWNDPSPIRQSSVKKLESECQYIDLLDEEKLTGLFFEDQLKAQELEVRLKAAEKEIEDRDRQIIMLKNKNSVLMTQLESINIINETSQDQLLAIEPGMLQGEIASNLDSINIINETSQNQLLAIEPGMLQGEIASNDNITVSTTIGSNTQSSSLPACETWAGRYNFTVSFSPQNKSTKGVAWTYSPIKDKLYVRKDAPCPINFSANTVLSSDVYIRVMALYTSPEQVSEIVQRCVNHSMDEIKNGRVEAQHLIRCESSTATYHTDAAGHHSVLVPFGNLPAGQMYSTYIYKFACFGSCAGGPNRRPLMLIFTLESRGQVIGRRKLDVKICACPGQDRKNEETQCAPVEAVNPPVHSPNKRKLPSECENSEDVIEVVIEDENSSESVIDLTSD